ncbi:MAG: erv26 super protein [Pycnora praestabilis]|nr:MAG: erv26 super protein [Pycnora praestabilis]
MWVLPLVGYIGLTIGFGFLTLAIASGLYYLSELVEEHTVLAKRLLTNLIYAIIGIQVFLAAIDRFPFWLSVLSVGSHVVYGGNLRRFPTVKLSDPLFVLSCVLVLLNHYLWFLHFSSPPSLPHSRSSSSSSSTSRSRDPYNYQPSDLPTFTEIASYFGLCVWLVPFALFVSLSAGENVLPSMGSEYATIDGGGMGVGVGAVEGAGGGLGGVGGVDGVGKGKGKRAGMAKAVVDGVREWVGETGELMGFWRGERSRRF